MLVLLNIVLGLGFALFVHSGEIGVKVLDQHREETHLLMHLSLILINITVISFSDQFKVLNGTLLECRK